MDPAAPVTYDRDCATKDERLGRDARIAVASGKPVKREVPRELIESAARDPWPVGLRGDVLAACIPQRRGGHCEFLPIDRLLEQCQEGYVAKWRDLIASEPCFADWEFRVTATDCEGNDRRPADVPWLDRTQMVVPGFGDDPGDEVLLALD